MNRFLVCDPISHSIQRIISLLKYNYLFLLMSSEVSDLRVNYGSKAFTQRIDNQWHQRQARASTNTHPA